MSTSRKAALGFIFVTVLIDFIGFGIIIPVMPKLIATLIHKDISAAAGYGGPMLSVFAIMQFLFAPVIGNLSDQFGRRKVLLISLFGFGVDYLFLAFAPTIGWLFVGRAIAGITGASFTTASAYIADISPPEKRAQNFGMIGAAFGLGFIIGPALGGQLAHLGTRIPFVASAILTFLNWLYGYFILPESLPPENRRRFEWRRANPVGSLKHLRKYPAVSGLIISLILVYLAVHCVQSTWTYYTMQKFGWDERWVGYSLGVIGVVILIIQAWLIRKIIPALGQAKSLYTGLFLYGLGMLLFGLATAGWMMFPFILVYCLGGISGPALQGIISSHVPANEQGELQGGLTSLMSVTTIFGPVIMTSLFSYFSRANAPVYLPGAPFLLGSFLVLLSALLAWRSMQKWETPATQINK
ncbi:MAG: TCR/Tet family MFS transporter [Bacteroidota bacterium]|nr:TCR/Tet family MFS transporter [Bacteroidota bacterium]MDP4245327.1 TCR/Tet family MFS transporter [Bacteroidota bacterium]MDP4253366.1 TCR/Tet family MFS transporter [Bacteroidota bacterium]MDP4260650.1 TCR/Tet family MFS transporter [Bacteroidota bacterium]